MSAYTLSDQAVQLTVGQMGDLVPGGGRREAWLLVVGVCVQDSGDWRKECSMGGCKCVADGVDT